MVRASTGSREAATATAGLPTTGFVPDGGFAATGFVATDFAAAGFVAMGFAATGFVATAREGPLALPLSATWVWGRARAPSGFALTGGCPGDLEADAFPRGAVDWAGVTEVPAFGTGAALALPLLAGTDAASEPLFAFPCLGAAIAGMPSTVKPSARMSERCSRNTLAP